MVLDIETQGGLVGIVDLEIEKARGNTCVTSKCIAAVSFALELESGSFVGLACRRRLGKFRHETGL